jgi:hypothetical protein
LNTGYTGNMKCSIFNNSGGVPTTVLGSAMPLVNPTPSSTFTFSSPPSVTKNTQYWIGFDSDTSSGNFAFGQSTGLSSTTAYASFPAANPVTSGGQITPSCSAVINVGPNCEFVNEAQEDGTTTYLYDSTVGHNDLYAIASLSSTPASTFMVTTRGFAEKTDAGSRLGAVQIKSGGTTVQSTSTALNTSFGWLSRTDLTDPSTSTTWTNTAVNAVQIGPVVTG